MARAPKSETGAPLPATGKEFAARAGAARSVIEGAAWPGIPGANLLPQLAVQFQLEQTQWWPPERLRAHQLDQLAALVRHAGETVPYYRALFRRIGFDPRAPLTEETWSRLPVLKRETIQDQGTALNSEAVPPAHGAAEIVSTSGSTGHPVSVRKTALQRLYWQAITLRDHLWHRRDFGGRMASIRIPRGRDRMSYPDGETASYWGRSTAPILTGPSFALSSATDVPLQAEWLQRIRPDYLFTTPTNLEALARHCLDAGLTFPGLRHVAVIAEPLRPEVRTVCRAAFGIEVKDIYSAVEAGYLALQSPDSEELLVQAETILIEVLDEADRPCPAGGLGCVVATPLHAFATPLIRYEIGDLAEVGGAASCGRGLPVIRSVVGRTRDMVRLPDGRVLYPNIYGLTANLEKIVQWQIARRGDALLELRLVVKATLDAAEEETLRARVRDAFQFPFDVSIVYRDRIPRAPSGKFFEYVSEVA